MRYIIPYKTTQYFPYEQLFPLYGARGPHVRVPGGYNSNSESITSLPWEEKNIKFSLKYPLESIVGQNPPKWKSRGRNVLGSE